MNLSNLFMHPAHTHSGCFWLVVDIMQFSNTIEDLFMVWEVNSIQCYLLNGTACTIENANKYAALCCRTTSVECIAATLVLHVLQALCAA